MYRPYWDSEIETLDRRALTALQLERLKAQLQRLYHTSPFYRQKWDAAGVKPEDVRHLEDITKLPLVTKDELREEQTRHPPLGRYTAAPRRDWREFHPSSGTTGIPVGTVWTEKDVETIADVTARTLWGYGIRPGDAIQNGFSYGLWVAGMAVHYAAQRIGAFVIPIGAGYTDRQIDFLLRLKPTAFTATPSFGVYLAEVLAERGIPPEALALRLGAFGGEAGTENPATRRRLEEGLGIDAYDYYGLAELGPTFAAECTEKAGLHWAEDHYLIEILDPETKEPLPPGKPGALVITHLTREGSPMVRYWTNDIAVLDVEPCACGRTHARSPGGILGRTDDMIIYKGAKFYPVQVEQAVRAFPELSPEYRIEVKSNEGRTAEVTVVAELARPMAPEEEDRLTAAVRKALREQCLVTPAVRLVPPGTLERTAFKAKRVVRVS